MLSAYACTDKTPKKHYWGQLPPCPPPPPSGYDSDVQRLMNFESLTLEPYAYWRCSFFLGRGGGGGFEKQRKNPLLYLYLSLIFARILPEFCPNYQFGKNLGGSSAPLPPSQTPISGTSDTTLSVKRNVSLF